MSRLNRVGPFVRRVLYRLGVLLLSLLWGAPWLAVTAAQGPAPLPNPPPESAPFDADGIDQIPAHVAIVDGEAQLEREGRLEPVHANVPLLSGDRIRTDRGRVEVLFADGSVLDIDQFSSVDVLSDMLLRLGEGQVHLTIARTGSSVEYRVDAAGTTAWIYAVGEYRIAVSDGTAANPEVRLKVLRGVAELGTPYGRTLLRAGDESRAHAAAEPSRPYAVTAASRDAFDRWTEAQRRDRLGLVSAQYLPEELRYYGGAFDRDGDWRYESAYGDVWYPRVATDWQPYYDGSWSFYGSFGWTWVGGGGRWAWPTHHYGRWGVGSSGWFWIPDRRWGPAWVTWASAPGYVGWCPIGYDNRPVFATASIHHSSGRYGWTVAPSRSFAPGVAVPRYAVSRSTPVPAGSRFVQRTTPPTRPAGVQSEGRPISGPGAASRVGAGPRSSIRIVDAPSGRTTTAQSPRALEAPSRRSASPTAAPVPRATQRSQAPPESRGPDPSVGLREVVPPSANRPAYSRVPTGRASTPPSAPAPTGPSAAADRPAYGRRPSALPVAPEPERPAAEPSRSRSRAGSGPPAPRSLPADPPARAEGSRPTGGGQPSSRSSGGSSGGSSAPRGSAQPRQGR